MRTFEAPRSEWTAVWICCLSSESWSARAFRTSVVAGAEALQLDRRPLELVELVAHARLAHRGRVEAVLDRRDLAPELQAELLFDLGRLPRELDHLRMVRAEALGERRLLDADVDQSEVQLLDALRLRVLRVRTEEVRQRVELLSAQELEAALHRDTLRLGVAEGLRCLRDALADHLLFLIHRDVRVRGREGAQIRFGPIHLLARLTELPVEELVCLDVGRDARLLRRLEVGLRVRGGEQSREARARRREGDLDQVGPANVLDVQVAEVAVEELWRNLGDAAALLVGRDRPLAREASRPHRAEEPCGDRDESLTVRSGMEKGVVRREMLLADHALREVATLQDRDLRREEARGSARVQVGIVEIQDVLLELQLHGGLSRDQESRRRRVDAVGHERDQERNPEDGREADRSEPAVLVEDPEVLADRTARGLVVLYLDPFAGARPPGSKRGRPHRNQFVRQVGRHVISSVLVDAGGPVRRSERSRRRG
jgi:hypothetical protein